MFLFNYVAEGHKLANFGIRFTFCMLGTIRTFKKLFRLFIFTETCFGFHIENFIDIPKTKSCVVACDCSNVTHLRIHDYMRTHTHTYACTGAWWQILAFNHTNYDMRFEIPTLQDRQLKHGCEMLHVHVRLVQFKVNPRN